MELKVKSVLDKQFQPMSLVVREMREATKEDGQDIVIGIVRNNGYVSAYKTRIYKDGVGKDDVNFRFIERMVKALLWVRGGYKIIIAGSPVVGEKIKAAYAKGGLRDFDNGFMARCYEHPFEVEVTDLAHAPVTALACWLSRRRNPLQSGGVSVQTLRLSLPISDGNRK